MSDSDDEIEYADDRSTETRGRPQELPMQQTLRLSDTFGETFHEINVGGANAADRRFSADHLKDENVWLPDFASEYDYCIILPEKALTTGTYEQYTNALTSFKVDLYCYKGVAGTVILLLRVPIDVLRNYADDINYQMKLDPVVLERMCKTGLPQHEIGPIEINHDAKICKYKPYDYVYYKYSVRVPEELYFRPADSPYSHPFGIKERLRLIATMIETKPKWGGENLKFRRYMSAGKMLGHFPLHQPEELRELSKVWLSWKVLPWSQPFYAIKEYFGEKIGLYYLFVGHYTRWLIAPAFVGLALQIFCWWYYPTARAAFNSKTMPFFSAFICLWAITMLEHWKRKESRTSLEWGTHGFAENETDTPEFRGDRIKSYVNGQNTLFFPATERLKYMKQSAGVVFLLIVLVLGVVASIYVIRQTFINHGVSDDKAQTYASIINALQIQAANFGYNFLATELTKRENHRTTSAYEDNLTVKVFAFQFINSYASFFYIAFIAYHLEANGCGANGCMYSLGTNLAVIFVTRLLSGNAFELLYPMLIGVYNRFFKQCCCCHLCSNCCCRGKKEQIQFSRPELEYAMARYETSAEVIADYTEIAIQFGYQALFVSALPCSSFLAFVSNIFEVKGDSWKMMNLYQRPTPLLADDIGAFQGILTIVAATSVVSNAALMRWTLTVLNDFSQNTQWWIFYSFQVVLFFVMVMLDKGIEDVPEDVSIQIQRVKYIGSKLIDHMADDAVVLAPGGIAPVALKEYKFYGSQVQFTPGVGYSSNTGSKSNSRHPSFSGMPVNTSTVQTDGSAHHKGAGSAGGAGADGAVVNPIANNSSDLHASLVKSA